MSNTNISDRKWVVNALTFWQNAKPGKFANRKLINWNIEQLTQALGRLDNAIDELGYQEIVLLPEIKGWDYV